VISNFSVTNPQIDILHFQQDPSSSSSEDMPFMEDTVRLEGCLSALRGIVGDTVPREELVRVALALFMILGHIKSLSTGGDSFSILTALRLMNLNIPIIVVS
jgi:hypothetical protein